MIPLFLLGTLVGVCGCVRGVGKVEPLPPIRTIEQWEEYRRKGLVPETIDRIYCSGGTLRLVAYLQCTDRVVAVDSNERRSPERTGMKAYLAAHPEFHELPLGGETSGRDNPELLLSLEKPPQLIIKADTGAGYDPVELTRRTGIPVVLVPMRGITVGKDEFDAGFRLLGRVLNLDDRAEQVVAFFDREIAELRRRTKNDAEQSNREKPLVYVGGVSYNGAHGFTSSEAGYPPFELVGANSPITAGANDPILGNRHAMLSKETLVHWDPDVLFLDLGTLNLGDASGLNELRTDPVYRSLTAVREGKVYTLLPNTFYFVNHDAVLINAWFVGKTLYPDRFEEIDPEKKADEIFTFLLGKPVFTPLNAALGNLALKRISMKNGKNGEQETISK